MPRSGYEASPASGTALPFSSGSRDLPSRPTINGNNGHRITSQPGPTSGDRQVEPGISWFRPGSIAKRDTIFMKPTASHDFLERYPAPGRASSPVSGNKLPLRNAWTPLLTRVSIRPSRSKKLRRPPSVADGMKDTSSQKSDETRLHLVSCVCPPTLQDLTYEFYAPVSLSPAVFPLAPENRPCPCLRNRLTGLNLLIVKQPKPYQRSATVNHAYQVLTADRSDVKNPPNKPRLQRRFCSSLCGSAMNRIVYRFYESV